MRSLYLICACLLAAHSLSAQQNFVPGTLLLRNGDSLKGQIDYRKWDASPQQIIFREGNAGKAYKPSDLKGFRIAENNEVYLSIAAELDVTREDLGSLSSSSEREIITGEHFFRILIDGQMKLLLYADKANREHFAVMEKDSVTQLVRKRTYINDPDAEDYGKLRVSSYYRQQLANMVGNCIPPHEFLYLGYSEREIRKVLQRYLDCRYPGEKIVTKTERKHISFGVMAGASYNMYNITGTHQLVNGKYGDQVSPVIGMFMDIPLSRNREKLSWNNELVYTNRAFGSDYSFFHSTYETEVDLKYIQLQTMIKYTYPKGRIRPYINLGLIGALKIGGKDNYYVVDEASGRIQFNEPVLGSGREFLMPVTAGLGVRVDRLHVEARFVFPHNISPYLTTTVEIISGQLMVRYALF